ncbi:DUF4347 domain-containing protein, partial [Nostoc sp. FACHB-973]|nr:DUF4347 domain-containing protein [Nostoc sp. FACHB-973]
MDSSKQILTLSPVESLAVSNLLPQRLGSAPLLVVFDCRVSDLEVLYHGLVPGAIAYTLNTQDDALSVITQLLTETGARQLAIVAHGEPGVVHIGASSLNREQVQVRSALLQEWGVEEILLYSCEVAKGEDGQAFVQQLSEMTGAAVAASATKTGSAAFDGNWQLQMKSGEITDSLAFQPEAMTAYAAVLAAGDLDPTFGTGGKVTTDFNNNYDTAKDVVLQPDGKVLVAGYTTTTDSGGISSDSNSNFALSRYNSNGTLDTTFGTGGKLTTDFNGSADYGYSVALQSDSKILVSGAVFNGTGFRLGLSRYNSNGTLDTTFGNNGRVTTNFYNTFDSSLMLQNDGKIVVTGDSSLTRFNSNGTLDTAFGTSGIVYFSQAKSATLQSDGKIVVVGYGSNSNSDSDFKLIRYNSNGTVDTSFGTSGQVTTDFNGNDNDYAYSVIQQSDGKIVVAGETRTVAYSYYGYYDYYSGKPVYYPVYSSNFTLVRYNSNGSLDTSFGTGGKVSTNLRFYDNAYSVIQQSDGKLVVAGQTSYDAGYSGYGYGADFAVVRYNSNGTLDTTFGAGGIAITDFGYDREYVSSIALQADGRIVAVGTSGKDFAIARYLGANETPSNISLTNSTLAENTATGAVIGTLFTTDGASDTHTYTLLSNAGGRFALNGNQIVVANGSLLDFESSSSHAIRVRTTDNGGLSFEKDLTIALTNVNEAPIVANAIAPQSTFEDSPLNFTVPANTFSDVDAGDTLTYTASVSNGNPLPIWLSFNPTTKTFSGTPLNQNVGSLSLKVTVTDSGGASVSNVFDLTIANTNDAPVVSNAIADQTATEDTAFSFVVPANTFSDVDAGDVLTYSATLADNNPLPGWLTFNAATHTFNGTPNNANVGSLNVKVTATDGNGLTASDVFELAIANTNDAPTVANSIADQIATEDTTFNFSLPANTFSDVDAGNNLTYSATLENGNPLPSWLTFNGTTFSGT